MTAIRELRYKTSTDYAELWEWAQRQSVACVADRVGGQHRDICGTVATDKTVAARTRIDFYAFGGNPDEFAEGCRRANLEWIVPPDRDLGDALGLAWGLIANNYGGDWDQATDEWRAAAERWRDTWLAELTAADPEAGA